MPPEWLDAARASVPEYIAAHGDRDFLVPDAADETNTPAHELVATPELRALFASAAEAGWPRVSQSGKIRSGLTVRTGPADTQGPAMLFHYDASVVTMVVPIYIPDGQVGDSAELVTLPNKRPFRRFLIMHVIDKLATHNSFYRRRFAKRIFRDPERHIVNMKPGNAYVFWGYRTLHGNLPCAANMLRSTLVLQYGEVHRKSPALSLGRAIGRRKVRRLQIAAVQAADPSAAGLGAELQHGFLITDW
ncbi:MAG: hypothetical protein QOH60_4653 [Mycobacterium sp.]|nr:hypothetical protein [Mycobacterium sp.]